MSGAGRTLSSDYMRFAKLETEARFNLASSGIADRALVDLGVSMGDLALHGPNAYGHKPLIEIIAARFGVDPACVVAAGGGCSFANHLALAALVAPGDEVLVEEPTYELLISTLGYLQATVRRFPRRPRARWGLDPAAAAAALTDRTRLVVLTNLHNPSSALAEESAISAIATAAAAVGARVLVDEVYLELTFGADGARTAFAEDGNVIVTSSLTKTYGLSGLRCGWILAPADLAERMRRLNDLFAVAPPHVAERLAVLAFGQLDGLRARANAVLAENRAAYRRILGAHPCLDQVVFDQGTTVFPRLVNSDGDAFFARLKDRFETSVVPGRFFGRPDHIRVGLGGEPAMTRIGLERLAEALGI
ncbi:MAG: pyridoxal phosphate-dependent aminotransferase [Caulobacteraceae bacterium]